MPVTVTNMTSSRPNALIEFWCVVETAHGLLNIEDSISAQIAIDMHLDLLDLRVSSAGKENSRSQAPQKNFFSRRFLHYSTYSWAEIVVRPLTCKKWLWLCVNNGIP
jgi:hypothetical protein